MVLISGNQKQDLNRDAAKSNHSRLTQLCVSKDSMTHTSSNPLAIALLRKASKPSDFLALYNPQIQLGVVKQYNRLEDVVDDNAVPTFRVIRDVYGLETAVEWVNIQVNYFNSTCEQQTGVTSESILEFAYLIVQLYSDITLYEFCYFLALCRVAYYGKLYGVSGTNQLAGMFQDFLRDRRVARELLEREKEQQSRPSKVKCANGYQAYLEQLRKDADAGDEYAKKTLARHITTGDAVVDPRYSKDLDSSILGP